MSTSTGSARGTAGVVVALALLATLPRAWGFARLGLDHFDEGAYALSALAVRDGALPQGLVPLQHFLSPPLWFGLCGLVMKPAGDAAAVVPSALGVLLGALTAPLAFLVVRTWYGRAAALGAGVLVALSPFHVAFSRSALTDGPFLLLFLAAVWAYSVAARERSLRLSLLAGLLVGLAWNTKYHGWLAGVVAALALLPDLARADGRERGRIALRFGASVLVACACYLPWFLYVAGQEGGYARLVEEHSSYLEPLAELPRRVWTQLDGSIYLDGWLGWASFPLALVAIGLARGARRATALAAVVWTAPLVLGSWLCGSFAVALALGAYAAWRALRGGARLDAHHVALWCVFGALTPLYHAYARLLLPLLVTTLVCAAVGLAALVRRFEEEEDELAVVRTHAILAGVLCTVLAVVLAGLGARGRGATWGPKDGLRDATALVAQALPDGAHVVVLGEPAAAFYLRLRGVDAEARNGMAGLGAGKGAGDYVLVGRYARWTGDWGTWQEAHPGGARELRRFPATVGDLRLLDDAAPWRAREQREQGERGYDLRLFELAER